MVIENGGYVGAFARRNWRVRVGVVDNNGHLDLLTTTKVRKE